MNDLNIINFLSHEKKATAREVAAALGTTPADTVNALLRIERQGRAGQRNGYWFVRVKSENPEQQETSK